MKNFFVLIVLILLFEQDAMASFGKSKKVDYSLGLDVINSTEPSHQYSMSRSRRTLVGPQDWCYKQFFAGWNPPTGFRPLQDQTTKYICQNIEAYSDETFYATMFDEDIGIAVYAAYHLKRGVAYKFGIFPRVQKWTTDPDIEKQGTNQIYAGNVNNIQKGHLVPAATYSFDCLSMVSTFKYTNAVPQYAAFNTGPWWTYEKRVRKFAKLCSLGWGDLYLLTGTSQAVLKQDGTTGYKQYEYLSQTIAIPNSMWTAGCCIVNGGVLGGFAAIGNNVQQNPKIHQVTVAGLEQFLTAGVGRQVSLFPGMDRCSDELNQYRYEEGNNPHWTKAINLS